TVGMYVAGTGIESAQIFAQAGARLMGVTPNDPGWRGELAKAAKPPSAGNMAASGVVGKLFINHARAFGWWNAICTANYTSRGEYAKAGMVGTATAGILLSGYPKFAKVLGLAVPGETPTVAEAAMARLGLRAAGAVIGNAATLAGSTGIYIYGEHEKAKII